MNPLDIAYFTNKLSLLQTNISEYTNKEVSRELAKLADEADKDAGLFLLQTLQEKRSK